MKIFQTLIAFLFFVVGTSAAYAGGALTDYTPPPPPVANSCGGPFAGAYIGGLLGLGGASSKTNIGITLKDNDRGFTGGGVAGYNWQCNGRLIGIESDISYLNTETTTGVICPTCGGGAPATFSAGSDLNWYGTVRARVGLVGDENFLVFATGGLAYGGVDHSIDSNNFNGVTFSGSKSSTQIGWTVGGGFEYLLRDNWSIRADAMYVDFGSDDETFTTGTCGGACTARIGYDDSFWVARVGLTYLFGARPEPVAYTPLK